INRAIRRIEEPRIAIPLIDGRRDLTISFSNPLDSGNHLGTGNAFGFTLLVRFSRGLAANRPRRIERPKRSFFTPSLSVIAKPLAPFRHVAQLMVMLLYKAARQLNFTKEWGDSGFFRR